MSFYDHWRTDRTGLGARVSMLAAERLFRYAPRRPEECDILEIGPGNGDFAAYCAQQGLRYTGVDANAAICERMRRHGLDCEQAMVPPISHPDGAFDLVVASHVIEHMRDWRQALEFTTECGRVTRAGGRVVFVAPDFLRARKWFWDVDYTHGFVTTRRRLGQLFTDAGLRTEYLISTAGPFYGPAALPVSWAAALIPGGRASSSPEGSLWRRLYKAKVTFIGGVVAVGRREDF